MTARAVAGFHCVRLHVKHGVGSCVLRHKAAQDPVCLRCPVGAAHARGQLPEKWEDGRPIVRLEVLAFDRIPVRRRRPPAA